MRLTGYQALVMRVTHILFRYAPTPVKETVQHCRGLRWYVVIAKIIMESNDFCAERRTIKATPSLIST